MILLIGFNEVPEAIKLMLEENKHLICVVPFNSFDKDKHGYHIGYSKTIFYLSKNNFSITTLFNIINGMMNTNSDLVINCSDFTEEEHDSLDNIIEDLSEVFEHLFLIDEESSEDDVVKFMKKIIFEDYVEPCAES